MWETKAITITPWLIKLVANHDDSLIIYRDGEHNPEVVNVLSRAKIGELLSQNGLDVPAPISYSRSAEKVAALAAARPGDPAPQHEGTEIFVDTGRRVHKAECTIYVSLGKGPKLSQKKSLIQLITDYRASGQGFSGSRRELAALVGLNDLYWKGSVQDLIDEGYLSKDGDVLTILV